MAGQLGVEEEDVHPVRINKELSYLRPCFVAQGKIDHLHITAGVYLVALPTNPPEELGPGMVGKGALACCMMSLGAGLKEVHGKFKQTSVLASCVLIENYYFMFFKDLMQCLSLPFPHSNHL